MQTSSSRPIEKGKSVWVSQSITINSFANLSCNSSDFFYSGNGERATFESFEARESRGTPIVEAPPLGRGSGKRYLGKRAPLSAFQMKVASRHVQRLVRPTVRLERAAGRPINARAASARRYRDTLLDFQIQLVSSVCFVACFLSRCRSLCAWHCHLVAARRLPSGMSERARVSIGKKTNKQTNKAHCSH